MEKGNTRSSASAKSTNSDSKTKQDVQNKHLRFPRFKESISPRPDTRGKLNPQRNRELFDKRPRNRAGAVCERYRSEVTEQSVNDSFAKQGSKKMNLNHLLNFTLTPIENRDTCIRRGTFNRNRLPKYNKELFLQANCQFVARDCGNYSVHQKNPDILVEWPLIEEIRLPSHEVPLCPICLYSPVAAKITRCGHIYCWPCILHYLALTDRTWQKCPICFEAVHKTELKSVSLRKQKSFNVGDEIVMCLMKREKGSLLPTPVTYENLHDCVCSVNDADSVTRFQKLLLASKYDIQGIIKRERVQLEEAYIQEKHTPEACFIETALKLLDERESNLNNEEIQTETNPEKHEVDVESSLETVSTRLHHNSLSSTDSHDEALSDISQNLQNDNSVENSLVTGISAMDFPIADSEKKANRFFYQSEDGQHIYLHNINVRMLVKEYGSLELAPPLIKAKIVEIERVSMTEVLRKRLRYLQHLPLTCEFQVVELNFFPLLSKPVFLQFESEINKRKYYRNKKARDERRRERYIEQEENKKMGKYPKATYSLESIDQFPAYQPTDFQSLSPRNENCVKHEASQEAFGWNMDDSCPSASAVNSSSPDTVPIASFAQMLKDGPKNFVQAPREMKRSITPTKLQPVEDSDDECVAAPEYHQSFSDAIQAALDSVSIQNSSANQKSSKKKKGKKQLLFTTSMCRNK